MESFSPARRVEILSAQDEPAPFIVLASQVLEECGRQ